MASKGTSSTQNTSGKTASGQRSRSSAAKKREAEKRAALRRKQQRISRLKEISLIIIGGICILLFISCFVTPLSWLKNISYSVFGIMMYVMPFALLALAVLLLYSAINIRFLRKIIALLICLFALQGILAVTLKPADGGLLGRANYALLYKALGSIGMYVVDILILAIGVVLFTDYSLLNLTDKADAHEKARKEAEEEKLRIKEEQRELKRKNAEIRRTVKQQAELDRLKDRNRALSKQVEENEQRLLRSRDRFSPIVGIGDTRISDSSPEEETTVYRPEKKHETRPADKIPGKYSNSGTVPAENASLKDIESADFPPIHVPSSYFKDEEEEEFKGVFKDHSREAAELKSETEKEEDPSLAADHYVKTVINESKTREETASPSAAEPAAPVSSGTPAAQEKLKSDPEEDKKTASEIENAMVRQPEKEYTFPPLRLLTRGSGSSLSKSELQNELKENAAKLKNTLKTFGVDVTITDISCGPAVTRYEIQPASGVKVSRIVSLTDDIKLNLAAADIRMEAPIPGKSAIGIEIPNKVKQSVMLRDILETDDFKNQKSKLAFAAGRDIEGNTIIADIARMPHVLVAGATGSGKSVCINSIIMSILYHAKPTEVKMIMVDPKVVELSVYNGIPHLLLPVVTDPKKAASALNWAVAEMEKRYLLFAEYGVRNFEGFNDMVEMEAPSDENGEPLQKMAQILIIVDELADLMMVAANDVETAICRLAQKARAAGLHLVLATQRPSVDVITGLIKANIPSRIAFAVSSGTDSRTILDMNGAEKLLGMGDMLYAPAGASKPVRVQGSYVSDADVKKVVDHISEQGPVKGGSVRSEINLDQAVSGSGSSGNAERDEYFADAGRLVIEKEKASIGMLQRAFKLGFNRAARIVDQLCDAGVVGEEEGTKPRRILMKAEEFEAFLQSSRE